ncbi:hypothetical protein BDR07DRAFT_1302148, partial [Suillus spraguei]
DHSFTEDKHNSVIIPDNKIYFIQTMQVRYLHYNVFAYDTINSRTHSDVMVLSGKTKPKHPYW